MITLCLILVLVVLVVGLIGLVVMAFNGCLISSMQLCFSGGAMIELIGKLLVAILEGLNS